MSYLFNNVVVQKNRDAFGRDRISESMTLGDYSHIYGQNKSFLSVIGGGGTISYDVNKCVAILDTPVGSTGSVIYQTRLYHTYMPGKSQLIFVSFLFNSATIDVTKRIGYFDDKDGVFFEQLGDGTLNFVVRDYVTGSQNNTIISQSNWNKDKCDGTGSSKFNLDITKTQLAFFDFQWLGVGRVRMGFVHDGEIVIAHEEYHSNNISTVYWSNPSLPVRGEINNNSLSGDSIDFICATVISEGGYDMSNIELSRSTELRTIATASFALPAMAIRLKSSLGSKDNRIDVKPGPIDILSENNNIKYELWRLPSESNISGGSWISAGSDSGVEYNITPTGWTSSGGDLIVSGFAAASTTSGPFGGKISQESAVVVSSNSKKGYITQNYDCTDSEVFAIIVTALTSSCNFRASFKWGEFL